MDIPKIKRYGEIVTFVQPHKKLKAIFLSVLAKKTTKGIITQAFTQLIYISSKPKLLSYAHCVSSLTSIKFPFILDDSIKLKNFLSHHAIVSNVCPFSKGYFSSDIKASGDTTALY